MAQVHPIDQQPVRDIAPLDNDGMIKLFKEQQKLPEASVVLAPDEKQDWHGIFKASHVGTHADSTSAILKDALVKRSKKKPGMLGNAAGGAAASKQADDCCGCCSCFCCCCGDDQHTQAAGGGGVGEDNDGGDGAQAAVDGTMAYGVSSLMSKKERGDEYTELTMSNKRLIVQQRFVAKEMDKAESESWSDVEGRAAITQQGTDGNKQGGGGGGGCCSCFASICPCFAWCCCCCCGGAEDEPGTGGSTFKAAGHAHSQNKRGSQRKHKRETMTVNFIMLSDIVDFTMTRMKDNVEEVKFVASQSDMAGANTGGCMGCDTVQETTSEVHKVVTQRCEYTFKLDIEVVTMPGNSRMNWKDWRLDDDLKQYHSTVSVGGALEWGEAAELEKLLAAVVNRNRATASNNVVGCVGSTIGTAAV